MKKSRLCPRPRGGFYHQEKKKGCDTVCHDLCKRWSQADISPNMDCGSKIARWDQWKDKTCQKKRANFMRDAWKAKFDVLLKLAPPLLLFEIPESGSNKSIKMHRWKFKAASIKQQWNNIVSYCNMGWIHRRSPAEMISKPWAQVEITPSKDDSVLLTYVSTDVDGGCFKMKPDRCGGSENHCKWPFGRPQRCGAYRFGPKMKDKQATCPPKG